MWNVPIEQFTVQLLVYAVKEITRSAVDDERKCIGRQSMNQANYRVALPPLRIVRIATQPLGHIPIERERADIDPTCRAAGCAVNIHMFHGEVKRAMSRSEEHTSELQSLMRISYA